MGYSCSLSPFSLCRTIFIVVRRINRELLAFQCTQVKKHRPRDINLCVAAGATHSEMT